MRLEQTREEYFDEVFAVHYIKTTLIMSNPNHVSIDKWLDEQKKLQLEFLQSWHTNNARNPRDYPDQMHRCEWDEQFMAFVELKDAAEQGPQD